MTGKALAAGAFALGALFAFAAPALAFVGPTQNPPSGYGAIGSDSSNNVAIGTSTTASTTKLLVIGATNDASTYAAAFKSSNGTAVIFARDDGAVSIATSTLTAGDTIIGDNLILGGTLTASNLGGSSISAGNVSAGQFGSNTGGGNYEFTNPLGVGAGNYATSTNMLWVGDSQYGMNAQGGTLRLLNLVSGGPIALRVNNSGTLDDALVVQGSGNVGIGTTNPLYNLDIAGGSSATQFHISNSGTGLDSGLYFEAYNGYAGTISAGSEWNGSNWIAKQSAQSSIGFNDGQINFSGNTSLTSGNSFTPTTLMTILPSGSVGIGTTNPGGNGEQLSIAGKANGFMTVTDNGSNEVYLQSNAGSGGGRVGSLNNQGFQIVVGTSPVISVTTSTNVGIGVTSPSAKLAINTTGFAGTAPSSIFQAYAGTVSSTAGTDTNLGSFGFTNGGNQVSLGIHGYQVTGGTGWTNTTIGLGMDVDNTTRAGANIWLNANGDVSIGTTAPDRLLSLSKSSGIVGISLSSNGTEWDIDNRANNESEGNAFSIDDQNTWPQFIISTSGYVGIGKVSPAYPLDVSGTVNAAGYCISGANCITSWPSGSGSSSTVSAGNVSSGQFGSNTGGGNYSFPGNVSIGTTTPLTINNNTELSLYGVWYSGVDLGGNGTADMMRLFTDGAGNGYLYTTAANGSVGNLYLGTASTTQLTILKNGNVGIGTTNPTGTVDIFSTLNAPLGQGPGLYLDDNSNNTALELNNSNGTGTDPWYLDLASHQAGSFANGVRFQDASTTAIPFLLNSSGNAYIGNVQSTGGSTISGANLTVLSSGDLGIGTTIPNALLTIDTQNTSPTTTAPTYMGDVRILGDSGANGTENENGGLEFLGSTSGSGGNGYGWREFSPDLLSTNVPLIFQGRKASSSWTDVMALGSGVSFGNVGIGTTTPGSTLTVNGTISISNPQGLAGPYLGVSGSDLTVSSTLASSSVSFDIYNATTTAPYNFSKVFTANAKKITSVACSEYAAATTTIELFYTTSVTATTGTTVLSSITCGQAGASATSFTNATVPAGDYLMADVTATAGTPTWTTVNVAATAQ